MKIQGCCVISALFLLNMSQSLADGGDVPIEGGDVPIDSARGSYEGAENIHWYKQVTLNSQTFEQGLVFTAEEYQCNTSDVSRS
jgi:hypothetical protein